LTQPAFQRLRRTRTVDPLLTHALYTFVIDRLTERPEVADVNTSVVYEHLPSYAVQPLR